MYVRSTLVGDLFISAPLPSFARILVYICHYCTSFVDEPLLVDGATLLDDDDDDCFYIALFSALEQTHCARM